MIEIVYIYNVFLIILYTLTLGFVLTYSLNSEKDKKYLFFTICLYLVFFIFDNLILSMTEIIKDFGNTYNWLSVSVRICFSHPIKQKANNKGNQ